MFRQKNNRFKSMLKTSEDPLQRNWKYQITFLCLLCPTCFWPEPYLQVTRKHFPAISAQGGQERAGFSPVCLWSFSSALWLPKVQFYDFPSSSFLHLPISPNLETHLITSWSHSVFELCPAAVPVSVLGTWDQLADPQHSHCSSCQPTRWCPWDVARCTYHKSSYA